jgi:hypothetical protein
MEPHNERDEAGAMSGPALSGQGNGHRQRAAGAAGLLSRASASQGRSWMTKPRRRGEEDMAAGLWRDAHTMTVKLGNASGCWRVVGHKGIVLADGFASADEAMRWAQGDSVVTAIMRPRDYGL